MRTRSIANFKKLNVGGTTSKDPAVIRVASLEDVTFDTRKIQLTGSILTRVYSSIHRVTIFAQMKKRTPKMKNGYVLMQYPVKGSCRQRLT